jgi:hypothetical protein
MKPEERCALEDSAASKKMLVRAVTAAAILMCAWVGWAEPAARITLDPVALEFQEAAVGDSVHAVVLVRNPGNAPLVVSAVSSGSLGASAFTASPSAFEVAAGGQMTLVVRFLPARPGRHSDALVIEAELDPQDPSLPAPAVAVSGTGVGPEIEVSPLRLTFASTGIGVATTQQLQISNAGNDTLNVAGFTLSDPLFGVDSGPLLLAPGGSGSVGVTYTPDSTPGRDGTLLIASDDFDEPNVAVDLEGLETPTRVASARLSLERLDALAHPADGDTVSIGLVLKPNGDTVAGVEVFFAFDPECFQPAVPDVPVTPAGHAEGVASLINRALDVETDRAALHYSVLFPAATAADGGVGQIDLLVSGPLEGETELRVLNEEPARNSQFITPAGASYALPGENRIGVGNTPPVARAFPLLSSAEDQSAAVALAGLATDRESAEEDLSWAFRGRDGLVQVTVSTPDLGEGPVALFFPPENGFGVYLVTAVVVDPAGARDSTVVIYEVEPANDPPLGPEYEAPADGLEGVSGPVEFRWQGSDPDPGDVLTYELRLGTDPLSLGTVAQDLAAPVATVGELPPDTDFYWQVVGRDAAGAETAGPIRQFSTGADRTPPAIAGGPTAQEVTGGTAVIGWSTSEATDGRVRLGLMPDLSDSTSVDEAVSEDFGRIHSVTMTGLSPETVYYYRVVSADGAGNQVHSGIGSFTTLESSTPTDPGDLDGDLKVDFSDFILFAKAFGARVGDGTYDPRADLNGDGEVDFSDFLEFAARYGTVYGATRPIRGLSQ